MYVGKIPLYHKVIHRFGIKCICQRNEVLPYVKKAVIL